MEPERTQFIVGILEQKQDSSLKIRQPRRQFGNAQTTCLPTQLHSLAVEGDIKAPHASPESMARHYISSHIYFPNVYDLIIKL